MMKYIKRLFLMIIASIIIISLTSCSSESTRNQSIPYGSLDKDSIIATSTLSDGTTLEYNLGQFYAALRKNGNSTFTDEVKKILYADEYNSLISLMDTNKTYSSLTSDEKKALSYVEDEEIDEDTYNHLKKRFTKSLENSLASSVYSTTSYSTYKGYTDDEKAEYVTKYIENKARSGYTVTESNIVVKEDKDLDTIKVDYTKMTDDIVYDYILDYAENLYSEKELYKIAGEEYVETLTEDDDDDTKEKNSYYYFTDDTYESNYESKYQTYGTYRAIVIQFNSRREAINTINNVLGDTEITSENVLDSYLKLYKSYYSYRVSSSETLGATSEEFEFVVNEDKDELSNLSSSIQTLLTDTLKVGDEDNKSYLTEPRNIDDKYVMAYLISVEYEYSSEDKSTPYEFNELEENLSEEDYNNLIKQLKTFIVETYGSSYSSTALKFLVRNLTNEGKLKIYDPVFEYNFENTYGDYYDLIDKNEFNSELVATVNGVDIKVDDLYNTLKNRLGTSIVFNYFKLAYASLLVDDYVDSDTQDDNSSTLSDAIDTFNNNENSSYPSDMGLENYLTIVYGYLTQDDTLKYYFNASSALSSYLSDYIDESWVEETTDEESGETYNTISTYATRILNYLLEEGNSNYNDIFSINLDHILINIDDDGDGSPDDPSEFLEGLSETEQTNFKEAVVSLAQAIYKEAINDAYKDNTLYETLSYIVKAYNRGETLKSDDTKTWDDYKKFNFLLTAEQLASSSDITQESVSSFVTPFADYVKNIYKFVSDGTYDSSIDEDRGTFIIVNGEESGALLTDEDDASEITIDTLCATTYGYHLLIINDYDGPDSLKFTSSDDTYGYQDDMLIKVTDGEDEDDDDDDVYVTIDSYNESSTEANINQLFIYMVQSYNGDDSSLDSDIESILSTLFDDCISAYSSTNFQNVLLFDLLNIQTDDESLKAGLVTERGYYLNQVTDYDNTSSYYDWLTTNVADFTRE